MGAVGRVVLVHGGVPVVARALPAGPGRPVPPFVRIRLEVLPKQDVHFGMCLANYAVPSELTAPNLTSGRRVSPRVLRCEPPATMLR